MVAAGGGTLDLAGLLRCMEAQLEPASSDGASRTAGAPSGVPTPPAVPTGPTQSVSPRPSTPATMGSTPTSRISSGRAASVSCTPGRSGGASTPS
ncbi:unnamed protein product [Phytophthora fragariaefolia]|uniref:Unnamed protein product n=1 Tax=Phytophthora fragariaefolia TaxID=1490495 RepID=A0A9W6TL31_9STRA|nr:unnamed protein product [Phytophthora fragariaefolia]